MTITGKRFRGPGKVYTPDILFCTAAEPRWGSWSRSLPKVNRNAMVTTTIRLQIDCDSTAVRLPFDCNSTALRPLDDLRYDRRPNVVDCGTAT